MLEISPPTNPNRSSQHGVYHEMDEPCAHELGSRTGLGTLARQVGRETAAQSRRVVEDPPGPSLSPMGFGIRGASPAPTPETRAWRASADLARQWNSVDGGGAGHLAQIL